MRGSEKQSDSLKATQLLRVGSRIQIGVSLAVNIGLFSCFYYKVKKIKSPKCLALFE